MILLKCYIKLRFIFVASKVQMFQYRSLNNTVSINCYIATKIKVRENRQKSLKLFLLRIPKIRRTLTFYLILYSAVMHYNNYDENIVIFIFKQKNGNRNY